MEQKNLTNVSAKYTPKEEIKKEQVVKRLFTE